jgi:hypothetical protein
MTDKNSVEGQRLRARIEYEHEYEYEYVQYSQR